MPTPHCHCAQGFPDQEPQPLSSPSFWVEMGTERKSLQIARYISTGWAKMPETSGAEIASGHRPGLPPGFLEALSAYSEAPGPACGLFVRLLQSQVQGS